MFGLPDITNALEKFNKYGGSEKKRTLIYGGIKYMVKFPDPIREKNNDLSYMNNTFSEFIGCKIFKSLGFDTQEVTLAKFKEDDKIKIVVMCRDFCPPNTTLNEIGVMALSKVNNVRGTECSIEFFENFINDKKIPEKMIPEIIEKFWDIFVVDTLIGNRDRHLGNLGFIVDDQDNIIKFAPVYDCGSSLGALLDDYKMEQILEDPVMFKALEYNESSIYRYKNQRMKYHQFYQANISGLNGAVKRIVPKIDLETINNIIDATPEISAIRKRYLRAAIEIRKTEILDKALRRILKFEKSKTS